MAITAPKKEEPVSSMTLGLKGSSAESEACSWLGLRGPSAVFWGWAESMEGD
jgi:hypothetical protein